MIIYKYTFILYKGNIQTLSYFFPCSVAERLVNTEQKFTGDTQEVKRLGTETMKLRNKESSEGNESTTVEVSALPDGSTKNAHRFLLTDLSIMEFDEKKTIKVSGISQHLQDQLTKEFQKESNSTEYMDDVNRVNVCPGGEDHVLIEFVNDIQGKQM